jgi:hypothetical protein
MGISSSDEPGDDDDDEEDSSWAIWDLFLRGVRWSNRDK